MLPNIEMTFDCDSVDVKTKYLPFADNSEINSVFNNPDDSTKLPLFNIYLLVNL